MANTLSATTLLTEVKESTRRISELVAAVRSYSQMDRASLQQIDVTDGLDTTLVMLSHKLSDEVTVVRDYGADVPRIEAYAGELNQVWTNLIDNALDAMDGAGNAPGGDPGRRGRRHRGDRRHRTGHARQRSLRARSSPSTRPRTSVEGTGLGLDIARRIVVERHGGTITIDSRPGETVLRVRLPVRPRS